MTNLCHTNIKQTSSTWWATFPRNRCRIQTPTASKDRHTDHQRPSTTITTTTGPGRTKTGLVLILIAFTNHREIPKSGVINDTNAVKKLTNTFSSCCTYMFFGFF